MELRELIPKSEFAQRHEALGEARGEARGEVRALLAVLEARGIELTEQERARIQQSTDLDELDRWVRRAATAASAHELFAG